MIKTDTLSLSHTDGPLGPEHPKVRFSCSHVIRIPLLHKVYKLPDTTKFKVIPSKKL